MHNNKVTPIKQEELTPPHIHTTYPNRFQHNVCRICLDGPQTDQFITKKLIKACKCTGSIQAVHQSCMLSWIISCMKHQEDRNNKIFCEICKTRIYFEYKTQLYWDFKAGCNGINKVNTCYLAGLVCCLIFIIVQSVMLKNSQLLEFTEHGNLVLIIGICLVSISSILIFMAILKIAYTKKYRKISKVYDISEIPVDQIQSQAVLQSSTGSQSSASSSSST